MAASYSPGLLNRGRCSSALPTRSRSLSSDSLSMLPSVKGSHTETGYPDYWRHPNHFFTEKRQHYDVWARSLQHVYHQLDSQLRYSLDGYPNHTVGSRIPRPHTAHPSTSQNPGQLAVRKGKNLPSILNATPQSTSHTHPTSHTHSELGRLTHNLSCADCSDSGGICY